MVSEFQGAPRISGREIVIHMRIGGHRFHTNKAVHHSSASSGSRVPGKGGKGWSKFRLPLCGHRYWHSG